MKNTAFRKGLLRAFAENGVSPDDIGNYIEKRANSPFQLESQLPGFGSLGGLLKSMGKVFVDFPVAASIGTGALTGAGSAYAAHKLFNSGDSNKLKEYKNQMLINELKYHIDKMKNKEKV